MPIPRQGSNTSGTTQGGSTAKVTTPSGSQHVRWSPLHIDESRYAIIILQGLDQSGKTHFAFTAPEPILVMTFDPANMRGVAKKFAGQKDIQIAKFEVPKGLVATPQLARIAQDEATRYTDTFTHAAEGDYFKTIIMDREDDAWELYRYEEFDGKASANPHHYVQLNMAYKAMLKLCEKNKKNLIMIDAIKEEYKNNKPTGEMKRAGFKNLGMLAQLLLEPQVDAYDNFSIQVIRCRDDATKNGVMLTTAYLDQQLLEQIGDRPVNAATGEPDWYWMNFKNVMAYLIGGTPEEWS
jgi:hypothetical protein